MAFSKDTHTHTYEYSSADEGALNSILKLLNFVMQRSSNISALLEFPLQVCWWHNFC